MSSNTIQLLRESIAQLKQHQIDAGGFCTRWRGEAALLSALPPRYADVMEDLLGRLESGSRFSEESCSYSQDDLLAALGDWLDKAATRLASVAPST